MAEPDVVEPAGRPVRDQSDGSSETGENRGEDQTVIDADPYVASLGVRAEGNVEPLATSPRIRRGFPRVDERVSSQPEHSVYAIEPGDAVRAEHDLVIGDVATPSVVEAEHDPHPVAAAAIGGEHACLQRECVRLTHLVVEPCKDRQEGEAGVFHCGVLIRAVDDAPVALTHVPCWRAGAETFAELRLTKRCQRE